VLIAPETRRIEWYTREDAGRWVYQSIEREGALRLESIDVTLDVAAIFAQLELLGGE
jgi:Uma2 family endonuclease